MRIPSGVTDQYIYFVAVDATDLKSRETGLTTWTVYRSRNGGAAAAMTTPTINETDTTNMPGVYELLLDEDMTIDSGDDSQEMVFHITHAGMAPVTRVIELYRPKLTAGNTLDVTATGAAGIDWGNVENPTTAVDLSGTDIQLCDTTTAVTNGVSLAAGAITDASLAGNMEIVFETDFATNYNATRNAWVTNAQDFVGTTASDPFNAQVVAASVTGHTNQTGDTYALANGAAGFVAIDTVVDAIKAKTDSLTFTVANQVDANSIAVSGSTTAADNMEASALMMEACIVDTVVNTHTPTTTEFQSDTITEATADHYIGRVVIFTSSPVAGLKYQATRITDYEAVGGIGQFTVEALTTAPANNDEFLII